GPRAIRVDMLERLADSIRPLLAWRPSEDRVNPPRGSSGDGGFMVTPDMMSILGCSSAELSSVLETLGFRPEKKSVPKPKPQPASVDAAAMALSAAVALASAGAGESTPEGAAGEESTATAPIAADAMSAQTAPDEVVEIEVWRPRRRFRDDRRPRHGGGRGASDRGAAPQEGADEHPHNQHQGRRGRHGNRGRDRGEQGHGAPQARSRSDQGAGDGQRQHGGRRNDERNDRNGGGDRRDRPRGNRDHRRDDRGGSRPQVRSASPQRKGGADPDSPFAALSALKQQLEKQAKDPA
ncbi:MAG: helicase, partial [Hyphomicrobiaceae bacterium]